MCASSCARTARRSSSSHDRQSSGSRMTWLRHPAVAGAVRSGDSRTSTRRRQTIEARRSAHMRPSSGSFTVRLRLRRRWTAQRPASSRNSPPAAPIRQATARTLPQGRQHAAGSAAVLSRRSQTSRSLESVSPGRSSAGISAGWGPGPPPAEGTRTAGVSEARCTVRDSAGLGTKPCKPSDRRPTTTARPRPNDETQAPEAGLRREARAWSAAAANRTRET